MTFRTRNALTIAALCLLFAAPGWTQWDPGIEGYSQFRYEYSDEDGDSDFDTRRVRIGWRDTVNDEGTEVRLMIGLGDLIAGDEDEDVDLIYAWVRQPFENGLSARLGFGEVRFGYDVPYSSAARLPFERSMAARRFIPGVFGLGALVSYQGETIPVEIDLQVLDGMDAWHDADAFDDAETLVLRVQHPLGEGGVAGISYMTSSIDVLAGEGQAGRDVEPDVWGAHVVCNRDNLGFRGEYFDGDWADPSNDFATSDADGWYAELAYTPDDSMLTPFYRYDEFSYEQPVDGEAEYSAHTLGVAYEAWANNRFTLQVQDIDMPAGDDTTVGLQWQVSYN